MKKLRNKFERFCYQNQNKGIPNLMLFISLGAAIVYILSMFDNSYTLYLLLCFDRTSILHGQIWRLFTFPLVYGVGNENLILVGISLLCYYSLGRAIEHQWGTLRFNLFYLTGIVLMDIFCLIFGGRADAYHLNLSLFLSYATLYPNAHFLLFFIIPVKAWIFALVDLLLVLVDVIFFAYGPFPQNLFPIIALANYFLFFGKDILNVLPFTWGTRSVRKNKAEKRGTIPFPSKADTAKAPYTHRCTVCGRTDQTDPELEFRYCSKCQGYHCYCSEHISNHTHI